MSEYQYYEFLAVDKTLSPREIAAVRAISSRADISATSFTNEYEWGDFKGKVDDFLTRFYDLHIYTANWGTHTFGIGLPAKHVNASLLKPYFPRGACGTLQNRADRLVLIFTSHLEGADWDESDDKPMASLAPIREEILAGDMRAPYLGWLASLTDENSALDDDAPEPPLPAGLNDLTPAQATFAEFMRVDQDLLRVAAEPSPPFSRPAANAENFIQKLTPREKDAAILAILEGRAGEVTRDLCARLRKSAANLVVATSNRSAGQLRATAQAAGKVREQAESAAKTRRRAEAKAQADIARAKYLDEIAPKRVRIWDQLEALIATRLPRNYDEAVKLLLDLRDLGARDGSSAEFLKKFTATVEKHSGKPSFQSRLRKAGLV